MLALGSDRIMFSVDYPYESTKEAVEFIDSAPLSDIDRQKIRHLSLCEPHYAFSDATSTFVRHSHFRIYGFAHRRALAPDRYKNT
jgi:hypothetical protein